MTNHILPLFVSVLLLANPLFAETGNGEKEKKQKTAKKESYNPALVSNTFSGTRIINGHSIETLPMRDLDVRITHRFGDISGDNGGTATFFGLDQSSDIRIALEYGVTDHFDIGIGRNKGAGPHLQLFDGFLKYKVLEQKTDGSMPISATVVAGGSYTSMASSTDSTSPTFFAEEAHRFAYFYQLNIARKFGDRLSLQVMPTYVHRNFVAFGDENGIFSIGAAASLKVTKLIGLVGEYFHNVQDRTVGNIEFTNSLAFGVEFDTGGHVFTINVLNARGINETQFIPSTISKWGDNQFRLGFTISRPIGL